MLPVYLSYFANGENNKQRVLKNAAGFVLGFTIVFVMLGAFAGSIGGFLKQYKTIVNIITGSIVVVLGLNFLGVFQIAFLNQTKKMQLQVKNTGFLTTILFGVVFSIGWTPCVGAFLGSALMMASERGTAVEGILMLIMYSAGLGIPFILSAVLIDRLKGTFDFIKKNYSIINKISGTLLVIVGIFMMVGAMDYFLTFLSFK